MDDHDGMMASLLAPVCLFTMHNVPVATSRTPGGLFPLLVPLVHVLRRT